MYVLSTGIDDPLFMVGTSTPGVITPKEGFYTTQMFIRVRFFVRYYSVPPKSHNVVHFTRANHYKLIKKFYHVYY